MDTAIIKINFKDYHTLKFGVWIDWCKSGLNGIDYFLQGNDLTKDNIDLVNTWLGFLQVPYQNENHKLCFDFDHVEKKTLEQKIYACGVLKKHKEVFEYLPKIIEIFSEKQLSEIMELPFDVAFEQGTYYLTTLLEVELSLQGYLKEYTPTNNEILAGYLGLKFWSNYGIYDSLAGGDVLKHKEVLQLSVKEAHSKIIYQNHIQHYQRTLQEIIHKNQKRK